MKARIVIVLFVLIVVAVVSFLLWRSRQIGEPAATVTNQTATQPNESAPPSTRSESQVVDLGAALTLDRLTDCARSPALASVLDQMVRVDPRTFESRRGGPIAVPGYDRPIVPTFERTREVEGNADIRAVVADLDLAGRWHGLAVTGFRRSFYEESDVGAFQVRFAERPARVRETLNRHGFRLPPVGEVRELQDEGAAVTIGVEPSDGGAGLTCATG